MVGYFFKHTNKALVWLVLFYFPLPRNDSPIQAAARVFCILYPKKEMTLHKKLFLPELQKCSPFETSKGPIPKDNMID